MDQNSTHALQVTAMSSPPSSLPHIPLWALLGIGEHSVHLFKTALSAQGVGFLKGEAVVHAPVSPTKHSATTQYLVFYFLIAELVNIQIAFPSLQHVLFYLFKN